MSYDVASVTLKMVCLCMQAPWGNHWHRLKRDNAAMKEGLTPKLEYFWRKKKTERKGSSHPAQWLIITSYCVRDNVSSNDTILYVCIYILQCSWTHESDPPGSVCSLKLMRILVCYCYGNNFWWTLCFHNLRNLWRKKPRWGHSEGGRSVRFALKNSIR